MLVSLSLVFFAVVSRAAPGDVVATARTYLGTPYTFGGADRTGVDCSGLVQAIFHAHGIDLPRTAGDQAQTGRAIGLEQVRAGDLLFFADVPRGARIQHVGLAIDAEHMIHASTSRRLVVVDSISSRYYRERFHAARRVLEEPRERRPRVGRESGKHVSKGLPGKRVRRDTRHDAGEAVRPERKPRRS